MARILVLGAGFAGLWTAIGAARKRDEIGAPATEVEILVVDRNAYHNIRVRNYEVDLSDVALPLAGLLDPIGVRHRLAEVEGIDPAKRQVAVATGGGREVLAYDRLVLTLGSELVRPAVPGLAARGFDVDTYAAAVRLEAHLATLRAQDDRPGRSTVVVVGGGGALDGADGAGGRRRGGGAGAGPPGASRRAAPRRGGGGGGARLVVGDV